MSPILELRKATKEFRGVPAIKDIDFTLEPGEIHAIVGENGAGKSTLTKALAGVHKLTSGEMLFDGKPMISRSMVAFSAARSASIMRASAIGCCWIWRATSTGRGPAAVAAVALLVGAGAAGRQPNLPNQD